MDKRLKKQKDFDLVFNKGKRIYTKTLTLIVLEKKESLKFGISLSKKHGKAVIRNRIKRLIRAAFKCYEKCVENSYYIVILPKIAEKYDFWQFKNDIEFALKKGKIIND